MIHFFKTLTRRVLDTAASCAARIRNIWMASTGKGIVATRGYDEYEKYVVHQKKKTCDAERIAKWQGDEWQVKLDGFKDIFTRNSAVLEGRRKALCLGARTGQEVKALWDRGIEAIGVDLVAFPPYTVEGDVHALQYDGKTFDLVFTNIFDHVLYPEKFCREIERVTAPSGVIMMHLQVGIEGDQYTETVVYEPDAVTRLFESVEVLESRSMRNTFDEMNWEIILKKRESAVAPRDG